MAAFAWLPALEAAGTALGGGGQLIGGITSALGMGKNMSQADQLGMQFDNAWTAYKRSLLKGPSMEIAGLKAAGINPLLRYGSHGSPTGIMSFGGGGAAPFNRFGDLGDALGNIASSAVDVARGIADIGRTKAETSRTTADLDKIAEEIKNIAANTKLTEQDRNLRIEQEQLTFTQRFTEYLRQSLYSSQRDINREQLKVMETNIAQMEQAMRYTDYQIILSKWNALMAQAEAMKNLPEAQQQAYIQNGYWGMGMEILESFRENVTGFGSPDHFLPQPAPMQPPAPYQGTGMGFLP